LVDSAGTVADESYRWISSALGGPTPPATGCSTAGTGDPNTYAEAVAWANSHIGSTSLGTG